MIDFETAQSLLQQNVSPLPKTTAPVREAVGRRLAAPVRATCDAPPFHKSMMDGYALTFDSLEASGGRFRLVGKVVAGQSPSRALAHGEAVAVMTGAPLPKGADTVVMLEHAQAVQEREVTVPVANIRRGQHTLGQGDIFFVGQTLATAGQVITPQAVGLLLEAGVAELDVFPLPRVAVLTTGSELCPAESQPGPGQIRNTNGPMLVALLRKHAQVLDLGIAPDQPEALSDLLRQGLSADLLVITGGVSTGELDLVPAALESLGVTPVFHKVAMKPGKPIWFGVAKHRDPPCLVFGLPGNPVSALVGCVLFVFQALRYFAASDRIRYVRARLTADHVVRGDRLTFWPSVADFSSGEVMVRPLTWLGSADQRCLGETNCLAYFTQGDRSYRAGESVELVSLSDW